MSNTSERKKLGSVRRVVVKIGSRVLVQRNGRPDIRRMGELGNDLVALRRAGIESVVVSSGAIASGLAGAGRSYRGGVRDYLLGTKSINGRAQITQFGGRVMKNVAGFDLFRPMAGAMGTLGVLLELSLRVIPIPEQEASIEFDEENQTTAIKTLCAFGKQLPGLSASGWFQGRIQLRLSGSRLAVNRGIKLLKKSHTVTEIDNAYWLTISQFQHPFFEIAGLNDTDSQDSIVAIDIPPATPPVDLPGELLIDWGGARRYLKTSESIERLRQIVEKSGGSATQLKGGNRVEFFHPLSPGLMSLHRRLKKSFDPKGILNPGRLYPDL
jgi:glycolate oxidase FAD binding subunit